MRRLRIAAAMAVLIAAAPAPAFATAEQRASIAVGPGTLQWAIAQIAERMGVSIALGDPGIGLMPVPRLAGIMTAETALRRAVRRLPVRVLVIDAVTFRLVRTSKVRLEPPRPVPLRPRGNVETAIRNVPEIVVTATKRDPRQTRYAGTIASIEGGALAYAGAEGTAAVERAVTSLNSTHLGAGRDKLFLRGVGDSSYSGQTQATVGQYLGEARLNYTGPDPALRLYDIERVELLLGPQGSLYGAGSLGGIMRIEPNRPDPTGLGGSILLSGSLTRHGAPGGEAAAVVNLPTGWADGAVRAVGYRLREGGYIDDVGRGVRDSDRLDVEGGRLAYAMVPAAGWESELVGLFQNIDARDAEYADRNYGALTRSSATPQPYRNRYRLGSLTVRHRGDALGLVAAVSRSRAALEDRFDGGESASGARFLARHNVADVTAGEIRAVRTGAGPGSWVVGAAFVESTSTSRSRLYEGNTSFAAVDARSSTQEKTLFGEGAQSVGPVSLSLGLRLVRWDSAVRAGAGAAFSRQSDDGRMLLPTTAALFNWGRNAQAFVRYARSYRPPIAAATLRGVNRLAGDRYGAWEFGVRLSPTARRPIDGSLSLSAGKWRDVQAETVDNVGNLSAANIGNARVLTIEGTLGWQFSPRLRASGGVTINDTSVARDGPSLIIVTHARLPNIPDVGARLSLSYASPQEHRLSFRLSSTVNYVGYSRPGIGAVLDRVQGGFVEVAAEGSISLADTSLFLRGTNLLDTRGDRFALGTIAQAALETQYVPQRPRTLTLGVRWTSPGSRGR